MTDFIFNSIWGWIGTAGVIVVVSLAVAWFIRPLRPYALAVAAGAISVATIFTKGYTARGRLEAKRKEEAVAKARKAYDQIDKRKDTAGTVSDRLRDGSF